GAIIDLCRSNNITVLEKNFLIDDVYKADEAFVTGTFAGVLPVTAVDEHVLSGGQRGPLTKRLQELYRSEIDKRYPGK
ncbi:MAG TPA: aminotransferase class IV, partial [Candidatus Marinimicrobia bacterium]|nr:aminotransferase class IV [Candidatus Neomarinimicrobiota bacterium]